MFTTFWGEQQATVGNRRGGLYLFNTLSVRRFGSPSLNFEFT